MMGIGKGTPINKHLQNKRGQVYQDEQINFKKNIEDKAGEKSKDFL